MTRLPPFAAAWLRQRDAGAVAVAAVEEAELASLDEAAALAMADALLGAVDLEAVSDERRTSSGFTIQQGLFARGRR